VLCQSHWQAAFVTAAKWLLTLRIKTPRGQPIGSPSI
jgi:hypothetical protein